ncbi:MAG: fatty acid desaturase [Pseudomonadota bacterium]
MHNAAMPDNHDYGVWNQPGVRSVLSIDQIKAINERRDLPGLCFFFGHVALMLATAWFVHLSWGSAWVVPALLLHGLVLVYWFQPFHECAHKTAFKSQWMNSVVYWFSGVVALVEPTYFYCEHMQHHRYTQHPERDPERISGADSFGGYVLYLTGLPYFYYQVTAILRHSVGHLYAYETEFVPQTKRKRVRRDAQILLAFYAALIALSIVFSSWALWVYWLMPRLLAEPFMRAVRLSEHQGTLLTPDLLRNTRTVKAIWPIQYLGWHACFHAEHHLSPNTPFHAAPRLHKLVVRKLENVSPNYLSVHRDISTAIRAGELPRMV